jgi:hypothetical protein
MNNKITFFSLIIFVSVTSCAQHPYFGSYERMGTNEKFKIRNDSTFEYSLISGYNKSYSAGKWTLDKGTDNVLLLKSFYNKENYPIVVEERSEIETSGIEVRMQQYFERSKDTVLWMSLIVNDSLKLEVKNNTIKIPVGTDRIKKLQLIFYYNNFLRPGLTPVEEYTKQLKTKVFIVGRSDANIFVISYPKIDLKVFDFYEFDNEKILISEKQLHWVRENKIFQLK